MSTSSGTPGSTAVARDDERRRRPWWLWALLALAALALLILGLTRCGADDPAAGRPGAEAAPPASAVPDAPQGGNGTGAAVGADAGAPAGPAGTLSADGAPLLPVAQAAGADGALTGQVGKSVTGDGVAVQSVPSDEGFWVGTSDTDRVWVQLTGGGESGYTVQPGDRVQFTGTVVPHDAQFAGQDGVDATEGADLLTRQAAHVEVAKSALREAA